MMQLMVMLKENHASTIKMHQPYDKPHEGLNEDICHKTAVLSQFIIEHDPLSFL